MLYLLTDQTIEQQEEEEQFEYMKYTEPKIEIYAILRNKTLVINSTFISDKCVKWEQEFNFSVKVTEAI